MNRAIVTGNFDGIHLGHKQMLSDLKKLAQEHLLQPCLVSFEPHTAIVVRNAREPFLLTTTQEKADLLEKHFGIELKVIEFNQEFMKKSPIEYLEEVLVGEFDAKLWLMGFNHTFGEGGQSQSQELLEKAEELGVQLCTGTPFIQDAQPLSSTLIRDLIREGKVYEANQYLLSPYLLSGVVEHGDALGRTLGFPTANLKISEWKLLPGFGVYHGKTMIQGEKYECAVHIGPRPSLDSQEIRVEAHLIDFEGDLYDQFIEIEVLSQIRPPISFDFVEDLKAQINQDIETIRLKNPKNEPF